jgi:hypothetical protein
MNPPLFLVINNIVSHSPLYSSTPPLVHDGHHSFNSQPAFVVKIRPDRKAKKRSNSKKKEKPYFVLMGDNWVRYFV